MYITHIKYKEKTCVVSVEGEDKILFSQEIISERCLSAGGELTNEAIQANLEFSRKWGMQKALAYIAKAARTEAEVRKYLFGKFIYKTSVNDIIDYLKINKFVNDDNYAGTFARSRTEQGQSKKFIVQKLKSKGISEENINKAFEEYTSEDEYKSAERFLTRQNARWSDMPPAIRKYKLLTTAGAKRFDPMISSDIVNRIISNEKNDDFEAYYIKHIDKRIRLLHERNTDRALLTAKVTGEFAPQGAEVSLIEERIQIFYDEKTVLNVKERKE